MFGFTKFPNIRVDRTYSITHYHYHYAVSQWYLCELSRGNTDRGNCGSLRSSYIQLHRFLRVTCLSLKSSCWLLRGSKNMYNFMLPILHDARRIHQNTHTHADNNSKRMNSSLKARLIIWFSIYRALHLPGLIIFPKMF